MPLGKLDIGRVVPIVGDGAIAHPGFADGRIIPVLVVDCAMHQQLYDLILMHSCTPPGDVVANWGHRLFQTKDVYLTLEFSQPLKTKAVFRFEVKRQASLVDGIIKSRGVYLQPVQLARRVIDGMDKPKILIEVPSSATFPRWNDIHRKSALQSYRRQGAGRKEAGILADEHLQRVRELWGKRMRPRREDDV